MSELSNSPEANFLPTAVDGAATELSPKSGSQRSESSPALAVMGAVLLIVGIGVWFRFSESGTSQANAAGLRREIAGLQPQREFAREQTERLQSQDWDTVAPQLEVPLVIRELNLSRELVELNAQQNWDDGWRGLGQLLAGLGVASLILGIVSRRFERAS